MELGGCAAERFRTLTVGHPPGFQSKIRSSGGLAPHLDPKLGRLCSAVPREFSAAQAPSLFIGAEDWTHVKPLTVDDGVHMVGQAVEQGSGQCRFRLLARDRYAPGRRRSVGRRGGPQ